MESIQLRTEDGISAPYVNYFMTPSLFKSLNETYVATLGSWPDENYVRVTFASYGEEYPTMPHAAYNNIDDAKEAIEKWGQILHVFAELAYIKRQNGE